MKNVLSLLVFLSVVALAACGGDGFTGNISEKEVPGKVQAEIDGLKDYSVNYWTMLYKMEQDIQREQPGQKPQTGQTVSGSVSDLYLQFQEQSLPYSQAFQRYSDLSQRLQDLQTGLADSTVRAIDVVKELPQIHKGLEESGKTMEEVRPKLDAIIEKYRRIRESRSAPQQ